MGKNLNVVPVTFLLTAMMVLAVQARKRPTQVIGQKPEHCANDFLFRTSGHKALDR